MQLTHGSFLFVCLNSNNDVLYVVIYNLKQSIFNKVKFEFEFNLVI